MSQIIELAQQASGISDELKHVAGTDRLFCLASIIICRLSEEPAGTSPQHRPYQGPHDECIALSGFEFHVETSWDGITAGPQPGIIA